MISSVTRSNGLAVYRVGEGPPLLLFPYPHASTLRPMGEDKLAHLVAGLGYLVITFDPPGAYRSTRPMRCDMTEMLACAAEALETSQVTSLVRVVGHSMGGLCALGFSIEHPRLVERLVLIGACSGFPAVFRWSVPHNWKPWKDGEWWQSIWLGTRQMIGIGNLAVHKQLDNLVERASFVDQQHVELWTIEPDDQHLPPPPRARWMQSVRQVDYRHRLADVQAPTLLCVGRYDPQTPLPCSQELAAGISGARLVVFERSGHSPFIEEAEKFCQELGLFLTDSN
jgi:proline iminopeptidase